MWQVGAGEGDPPTLSSGAAPGQTHRKTDVCRVLTVCRGFPRAPPDRHFRQKCVTGTQNAAAWRERLVVQRKTLSWECALSFRNDLGAINFR